MFKKLSFVNFNVLFVINWNGRIVCVLKSDDLFQIIVFSDMYVTCLYWKGRFIYLLHV